MKKCGEETPEMIDYRDGTTLNEISVRQFFDGYVNYAERLYVIELTELHYSHIF